MSGGCRCFFSLIKKGLTFSINLFAAKLQRQRMVKYPTRSSDRNDVISNVPVPAIISTSASPTDSVPPSNPLTNLVAPLATKRHGRVLQKSSEIDIKSSHAPNLNQQPPHHSHTRSDDLAYCTKCGGLTTYDKPNLAKKRYFSLDKERSERTTNFLQCIAMNRADTPKSGSENLLSNSRKQCSFDGTSEKSFGRTSNSNVNNSKTKPQQQQQQLQQQSSDGSNQMKNGTNSSSKKVGGSAGGGSSTQRDCTTSCSNRSLKDKSNKSSQNSLREPRTSRKNSIFHFGSSDRDTSASRGKKNSQQYARKQSTRGPINLHEEQDSETREILLGSTTSHSKFDKFAHEIKIPEPVEAVR